MRLSALAFLCGILALQLFSRLPSALWVMPTLILAGLLLLLPSRWRCLACCALGFAWALYLADAHIQARLPDNLEGKNIPVTGYIASIPNASQHGVNFLFSLQQRNHKTMYGLLKLSWTNPTAKLVVGDQWHFTVRLKKPYGTRNPGGFDYEAFAFQANLTGNGYVIGKLPAKLLSRHWYSHPVDRVRQYFKETIAAHLPVTQTSPWITALAVGERNDINAADWQVLRNTGTNHLMAIAGLHIGFMAFLAHFCVEKMWRWAPRLTLLLPAVHAGAVGALAMALTYSALAGFSIPTQRACWMLFVFLTALLLRRKVPAWHAWSAALWCVLLTNPFSVLTESFWLSFGSVALIVYGVSGRLSPSGLWWKWGRIQWVIALGLVPLSVALFQQCSLISFVANSVAIPWVGFVVVPFCFLGTFLLLFSAKLGGLILLCADKILGVLWIILTWFAHLPGVVWYQAVPSLWMIFAGVMGVVFLLLPVGTPGRYLGVIWLLPLMLYRPSLPQQGDVWLTVLDVGQGLAAVVQTEKHTLVFDTGPRFGSNFDMGDSIVLPYLRAAGARQVDMLVISHGDNDHIGGARAVLTQFPVKAIRTSVPDKLPGSAYCFRGQRWEWDGVQFEFLYPTPDTLAFNNDSSCVLRVTRGTQHVLLTGDIEKYAENELTDHIPDQLPADILIAPHHGSKTSGVKRFLQTINPVSVVFATGYRNRYHFPHVSVVRTYSELAVRQFQTDKTGAIQFRLDGLATLDRPSRYRLENQAYWHN